MEADIHINERIIIPGSELELSASRSSGPGGQHVQKTNSRVSLRWNLETTVALNDKERDCVRRRLRTRLVGDGDILIHVESERSQQRNREIARQRLLELIQNALLPIKKRFPTSPTKASKARRIDSKKRRSIVKKLRTFKAE